MDLSIVIVTWNTREPLRACLTSLHGALAGAGLSAEVIVVDNASADASAAMVAAEFPKTRLIANAENRNYAAGTNQALALATGDLVLLLNPDTEVPPGALEALAGALGEHPDWGAAAPALVLADGRVQDSVRGLPTPRRLVGEVTGLARLFPGSGWAGYRTRGLPLGAPSEVEQPMASALLVRRAALEQVGGLDEQFPLFFNDVDLCARLRAANWAIGYDPRVRVRHLGGAATRQVRPAAIRASHRGLERFYAKHYRRRLGPVGYALAVAAIRLSGVIRAGIASLRGLARSVKAGGD